MVRLVVVDNDGTIAPRHCLASDRTIDAFRRLKEKGIMFGFASGRDVKNVEEIIDSWGIKGFKADLIVGVNGCSIKDNLDDKLVESHFMSGEQCIEVVDYFKKFDFLHYNFFSTDGKQYISELDDFARESIKGNHGRISVEVLDNYEQLIGHNYYKVLLRVPEEKMEMIQNYVIEHPFDLYQGFRTQLICYEVCLKGVGKNTGIEYFCEKHDIPLDEVWAFGDTSNDIPMFKVCHGVCLKDGSKDALAAAEYITDLNCDEDGLADFIEKHFLND